MALTNDGRCFNIQLILGQVTSLYTCLFSTQCLSKHHPVLRYPDRRRKRIPFRQEREPVTGKHIQESQSSPRLPWKPVWEKGVKSRSSQSFAAGILAHGYGWLPQGSAPCTQLRICCVMSVGKHIKERGEREFTASAWHALGERWIPSYLPHWTPETLNCWPRSGNRLQDLLLVLWAQHRFGCKHIHNNKLKQTNKQNHNQTKKKPKTTTKTTTSKNNPTQYSIAEEIKKIRYFFISGISCALLKVFFFKVCALIGADRSVHRLLQFFILSFWLQKFRPLILLTSMQLGLCRS